MHQTLVVTLMQSKLDYGKATLAGLPACQVNHLQSSIDRLSSFLGLHYLPIAARGHYQVILLDDRHIGVNNLPKVVKHSFASFRLHDHRNCYTIGCTAILI